MIVTYQTIIEAEVAIMVHLHINPFDFGDLPLIDFHMYYAKVINTMDEINSDIIDGL